MENLLYNRHRRWWRKIEPRPRRHCCRRSLIFEVRVVTVVAGLRGL
jgi:hypothetical protein